MNKPVPLNGTPLTIIQELTNQGFPLPSQGNVGLLHEGFHASSKGERVQEPVGVKPCGEHIGDSISSEGKKSSEEFVSFSMIAQAQSSGLVYSLNPGT